MGGGSAGCALVNRLSSNPTNKVLLLEAGSKGHFLSRVPVSFSLLIDNPAANWCYRSEPEAGTNERQIPIPRGKLLGGSSAINGLVYARGQQLEEVDDAVLKDGLKRLFPEERDSAEPNAQALPAAMAVFALVRHQVFAWYVALSLTGSLAAGFFYQLAISG